MSLSISMCTSIANLQTFLSADADIVLDALRDNPYGEFTDSVKSALDTRLAYTATRRTKKTSRAIPQVLKDHSCFMTQSDIAVFQNPKVNIYQKMSVLVARWNRLGVTNPHEQTYRWGLALVILQAYADIPPSAHIFKLVEDCKAIVDAERKQYPHDHLVIYPDNPSGLSEHMSKYAYDADDQPITLHMHGYADMAINRMVMRKNNKLLRSDAVVKPEPHVKPERQPSPYRDVQNNPSPHRGHAVQFRPCRPTAWRPVGAPRIVEPVPPKVEPAAKYETYDGVSVGNDMAWPVSPYEDVHNHSWANSSWYGYDDASSKSCHKSEPCSSEGVSWGNSPARGRLQPSIEPKRKRLWSKSAPCSVAVKGEPTVDDEAEADNAADSDDDGDAVDSQADLDEYAKAAINAIRVRDKAKANKAAAKVKATRAALAAKQESSLALGEKPTKLTLGVKVEAPSRPPAMKTTPASSCHAMKTTPVPKVKNENRSDRPPKQEPIVVTKDSKVPVPSGDGQDAPPSIYKNGRIYFKVNKMAFRIIRKFPVYRTERKLRWAGKKPTNAEWKTALRMIDDYKDA